MKSVLFIIAGDPRTSGRPAEAVRMAAGLAAWKKLEVAVYLHGASAWLLGAPINDCMEGEDGARYLSLLKELGRPVYVQSGALTPPGAEAATSCWEPLTEAQIAAFAAGRDVVLHF